MALRATLLEACKAEMVRYQSYIDHAKSLIMELESVPDLEGVSTGTLGWNSLELYCQEGVDPQQVTKLLRRALYVLKSTRTASNGRIRTEMHLEYPLGPFTRILVHGWPGSTCKVEKVLIGTRVVEDYEYKITCEGEEQEA